MKTYVIILSEKFPTTHPRKEQETEFGRSFLNGKKIHTIRGNFPLWEKRLKEVQEERAVLSVRQWTGVPYRSPQKELRCLTSEDGVGVQILSFSHEIIGFEIDKRGYRVRLDNLSENDGLSLIDWEDWFKGADLSKPLAIIHFTKYRY